MNRLLRISLVSTLALAVSACRPHVSGNGVLGEEQRTVAPFDGVEISLGAEATVTANATTQKLTISVDENLLQYIRTPVENGVLKMRLNGITGIDSVHPLRLVAQAKALNSVRASEAANVDVKEAGDPTPGFVFEVVATGLSNVQLQGPGGDQLQVNLSGGSWLDAWSYPVTGASVVLTGGSHLRVHSSSDVLGTVSDTSSVEITGGGTCAALTRSPASICTFTP